MDIDVNKAKAALRMTRNQIADAVLIATDKQINWEDKKFLFYDNDELLDKDNLDENLIKEIKMEYPYLNENQITERLEDIFTRRQPVDEWSNSPLPEKQKFVIRRWYK